MRIAKPIRVFCCGAIAGGLSFATFELFSMAIGRWALLPAMLLLPVFAYFGGIPIDVLDFWLRKRTRDPLWLLSSEGQEWLKSPEGAEWSKNQEGQR